ncbi:MAG: undecaprenyl-diphosphate phosphatase [Hydrogenophaga sp.]|jgi:undecaprenyl-diphosphatase|uniref:undecaprenyl-diphosphate phosphatase n=1 Tax=Hydrogenophaga sp. TaxID=1904254 RepID=UPI0025B8D246|nr:undecaprenyl-diphosphate phosphatase [Hydrogenophaga sp.]MDO8887518.1 undecaprenyl-diphosphate phosphatase [Hydrogenophaga sp.]MDO9135853.1 undecaprenyl-diphosphate phosphatase [Hydrogenophaga sp.]MDO9506855.1 undecaprenyl-diphosphate phosphatase [Hydrogenophaga sp.]MDP1780713.1 undecaprenyl-diphosphate phosphatase [Hydrogenophaga sp.]MDP2075909.1 undecaprenyl-diphosphate phosphatase [Hydrogenophaga sp.]
MDFVLLIKAAIMGVVEGLTEFIPVSSTGHLILAASLLNMPGEKIKLFEVVIQTGAIMAIISLYAGKLWDTLVGLPREAVAQRFTANVLIGFFPAALAGFLFIDFIKGVLFQPLVVALGFIVGGVVILWAEWLQKRGSRVHIEAVDQVRWTDALKVGLVQCTALVPGVSRSGATIIGAMLLGFNRKAATEFSFFLAIPMLFGAAAYDLYKNRDLLSMSDVPLFAVGLLFSWLSAWVCVRWLLRFVANHTFVAFAWYRIAFGALILLTATLGWVDWVA